MKKMLVLILVTVSMYAQEIAQQKPKITARARKQQEKQQRVLEAIRIPQYESGRQYYDALIEDASKRHWAIPISFYFSFADTGYDCTGCKSNLAATIFGKNTITIQDLYLFAKLSIDNKVRINNCEPLQPNRGAIPIMGSGSVQFGGYSDDLYTTLLAPVEILFDAQQREFVFVPSIVFHYDFGTYDQYALSGGINIPIKSRTHELSMGCKGGELFKGAFLPDTVQSQNTSKQFFKDFTDVSDFILREIFDKKGIEFEPVQRKTGFGDISLFAAFEYHSNPSIEAGLAFVFPTSSKNKNNKLWEPSLGIEAFQVNPFIQCLFSTDSPYLNPFVRVAGEFSTAYSSTDIRVPRLVTNDERRQVQNVPGLDHPSFFNQFYVDEFSEFDSCVPLISKKACIKQTLGHKIIVGIGNYSYQMFHEDFRLGIFYDYMHKSKDSFDVGNCDCCCGPDPSVDLCLTCTHIDMCTLEKCSDQKAHIVSANLVYKFNNLFEIGFGGEFVVLGKNVPNSKTGYFNLVIVF